MAQIRRVVAFRDGAANGDWSAATNGILFERAGEIFVTTPAAREDRCVTCGVGALPAGARKSPVWRPGGNSFAFVDRGIWVMDADSRTVRQIYRSERQMADVRFSRDGAMLAWMEGKARVGVMTAGELTNVRTVESPVLDIEAVDDFAGDRLLVTASRRPLRETQVYSCAIQVMECVALTAKGGQQNDFARLTPSGKRLLFASTDACWFPYDPADYKSDYWLTEMGAAPKRMTWFNEPANPNYIEPLGARVTKASWGPGGRWLLATVVDDGHRKHTRLMMIEFPEAE